ncbi:contractile injection system tape measure protein [Flavobacterium polysaccharolyticum]|uniref:Contractile injection system tape measure protein n=1 Tax=Flavobacterium polysaccharolyticum TaxID=3133148 RepID=A0ABU9NTP3_9FLAO
MTSRGNHIISKLKWENSFDKKENAHELQQRISVWSKTKMPNEITALFDKMCPESQTWSIPSLTLDLGHIDYDILEEDLSLKLCNQLSEQLFTMILNAEKRTDRIEISNTKTSQIDMLGHYFLTGAMPWNYKNDSSLNKMMEVLFISNKEALIKMLNEVGKTDENVRKRIAWQLQESIILKIIEGLETSNHNQIIKFSEELTKIQQQETLVPANENDFKKNLWFWILNYLFTDRGTIFNKVAFMKSSIQQMSNHYNVSYSELLNMIELAIQHIYVTSSTKADFILILNLLTKENELIKAKTEIATIDETDYWIRLKTLFNSASLLKESISKSEFNELILVLSKENKTKFSSLFSSLSKDTYFWTDVVQDLSNEALENIFHAILPVASQMLIDSIYFIEKLYKEMNEKIAIDFLWQIGIQFLIKYKNTPFDNKTFLNFILNELSKKNNELKESIVNRMTNVSVPSSSKTIATLEIYTNLTAILIDEVSEKHTATRVTNFNDLITELAQKIRSNSAATSRSLEIQKLIIEQLRLNPTQCFETIIQHNNKETITVLFPYILDKKQLSLFVKKGNHPKLLLVQTLERIIKEINQNSASGNFSSLLLDNLYLISVKLILLHTEYTSIQFLEAVLAKLLKLITPSQKNNFDVFVTLLFKHEKIQNISTSENNLEKIRLKLFQSKTQPIPEKKIVKQPIATSEKPNLVRTESMLLNGQMVTTENLYEWLTKSIQNETLKFVANNQEFLLKDLLQMALEINPSEVRKILSNYTITEKRIKILQTSLDWSIFSLWITNDSSTLLKEAIETLKSFYEFIMFFMNSNNKANIENSFWKITWEIIQQNKTIQVIGKPFIEYWINQMIKQEMITSNEIMNTIISNKITISPILKDILIQYNNSFSNLTSSVTIFRNKDIQLCEEQGLIEALYVVLITEKKIPLWYNNTKNNSALDLFHEVLEYNPIPFIVVYKQNKIPQLHKQQLYDWMDFRKTMAVIKSNIKNNHQLHTVERMHTAFGQSSIKVISGKEIQTILLKKIILAWTENNWTILSVENIWQELLWELSQKKNISTKEILLELDKIKYRFAPALQISLNQLIKSNSKTTTKNIDTKFPKELVSKTLSNQETATAIPVKNAGIVILNNYIEILMDRLGLLNEKKFKNSTSQLNAVHYIQYVITGLTKTEESLLPLNKVLCGLPITTPVKDRISITEEQSELINGLIKAAISHWPKVGDTSILGFRGNWLVRDGLLIEKEERWELTVEKRVYDLLIHKSPFSFSIIKYPWMKKPLHVIWPY